MLFNSYSFIFLFLPLMLLGYFWFLRHKLILGSKVWLVGGSLFFYGYWNMVYIPLLLGSILVNFLVGSALSGAKLFHLSRKMVLGFGIIFNIALLGYFKYTDFLLENVNDFWGTDLPLPDIILPLGISFFTFTQIAFLVDAYKAKVKEVDFLNYILFVSYFPHLLAGPILHHAEMMPQFVNRWNWTVRWRNIAVGLFLFTIGLFKKVIIADTFAVWANAGFDVAHTLNLFEAWATSLSYTLQLYFDFSGYTDMAIGISLMFNIRLPINFNSPYKARDIQDFWRRWHITLSRFLRDYIYIPLGGNKVGRFHNYGNLFAVFLIGGLWHGASWMFVIWGALHGVAIVIHRIWKDLGLKMWDWLGWFITFNFVNVAWVFFRAEDFDAVTKILGGMIGQGGIMLPDVLVEKWKFLGEYGIEFGYWVMNAGMSGLWDVVTIMVTLFLVTWMDNSHQWSEKLQSNWKFAVVISVMLVIGLQSLTKVSEFLYFNF
jgi:D-alanyl-lipoteichoic acid acyltransferase DltB (MBOAT superfamily)